MKNLRLSLLMMALSLPAAIALGCGGSMQSPSLQSITVTPSVADAQNFPNGQVQFTATGIYNTQPPVNGISAIWGVCQQNVPTTAVTVNQSGLAQCTAGASGTFSVFAGGFPNPACNAITACGGGCMISGHAQLTCP